MHQDVPCKPETSAGSAVKLSHVCWLHAWVYHAHNQHPGQVISLGRRSASTPGVGGLLRVERERVVVAAGDRANDLVGQRANRLRRRLRRVHQLHARCRRRQRPPQARSSAEGCSRQMRSASHGKPKGNRWFGKDEAKNSQGTALGSCTISCILPISATPLPLHDFLEQAGPRLGCSHMRQTPSIMAC